MTIVAATAEYMASFITMKSLISAVARLDTELINTEKLNTEYEIYDDIHAASLTM